MFGALCAKFGITHKFTRPHTPRTNGKVERMIQTLLRERAYRFRYESSAERKQWLRPTCISTTITEPHSSLGDNPPISRLVRNNVLRRNS